MAGIFDKFDPQILKRTISEAFDIQDSELWLHRIGSIDLYINYDFKENECPIIMTYDEIKEAEKRGCKIVGCDKVDSLFDEDKEEIISKLNKKGLSYSYPIVALRQRLVKTYASYFQFGLYTIYKRLDQTAIQCSEESLQKILRTKCFGFPNRGITNVAIVLKIPLECFSTNQPKQLYEYAPPRELVTEYFGIMKSNKVIPKQYIKELVAKFGNEIITIPNPDFEETYQPKQSDDVNDINLYDQSTLNFITRGA